MKALTVTVLLNIALLVASKPSKGEVKIGCDILKGKYPSSVFFPGEARYDFENECKIRANDPELFITHIE